MDGIRDEFTQGLSYYARRVFYGDMTLNEVPEDCREKVKEELIRNGLKYLI